MSSGIPRQLASDRMDLADIALAVELTGALALTPEDAIAWIRADVDASIA